MARAKRFYLCNLIPLWQIDNAHLEVDWTQEAAKNGEIVEMRVVVKDLDLNMTTPDFTIEFEVNENDVLLFGGLDDRVVTITNKAAEKKTEHRDIAIIGANDAVPTDQRLTKIFLSPLPNAAPQKLIRAFWPAAWQKDVAGSPEYYFDVKLEFTGKTFKERSDRELTVSEESIGTGVTSADPTVAKPLVLPAVGWSLQDVFAEKTVNQLALLDQPNAGKPVSFVITPDVNATLLWILFIPKSNDAPGSGTLLKDPWTVPRFLPLENIKTLSLKGKIGDKEVNATTVTQAEAEKFPGQKGGLFGVLKLNQSRAKTKVEDPETPIAEQQTTANTLMTATPALVKLKKALDKELAAWATANNQNITPTHREYAYTIQQFAFNLTHGSDSLILERPSSSSELKKWNEAFQKAYLMALMIMSTGATVDARENRTEIIAQSLAEAGFNTEALNVVGMFSTREEQKVTYETILKAGNATAEQWPQLMKFLTAGTGTFSETEFINTFGFNTGTITIDGVETRRLLPSDTKAFITNLGANNTERNSKLDTITTELLDNYANDPDLVWVLSGFLFLQRSFRQSFSDKIWRDGRSYLLYKILNSYDFTEPGYLDPPPTWNGETMEMERDMPWVYQNKQRFGVDYLVFLCERAGTPIPRPTNLNFTSLRAWLEAQTETIAAAAPKVYPDNKDHWFQLFTLITDAYFFHVELLDVRPDPLGHLTALVADAPARTRMRADCDVFAAYGTRFLRTMGFTSIGYMGILPVEPDPVGHVEALLKKDDAYFAVNNKDIFRITAATEAAAITKVRDHILRVLGHPATYQVYYAPSDATGAMSGRIRELGNEIRRTDLE